MLTRRKAITNKICLTYLIHTYPIPLSISRWTNFMVWGFNSTCFEPYYLQTKISGHENSWSNILLDMTSQTGISVIAWQSCNNQIRSEKGDSTRLYLLFFWCCDEANLNSSHSKCNRFFFFFLFRQTSTTVEAGRYSRRREARSRRSFSSQNAGRILLGAIVKKLAVGKMSLTAGALEVVYIFVIISFNKHSCE